MTALVDYIKIKHGYAFKGEYFSSDDNGVVLLTPGNFSIGGGFKEDKCKYFTSDYPDEYVLKEDDLIVTMTDLSKAMDTLGYSALIPSSNKVYLHNQRIGLVEFLNDEVDKHYLYWFMRTKKYQKTIASTSSGSTVHHTSPDRICSVEIDLPNINTQRAIAFFLDKIEEKIILNKKINKNLLYQMKLLFQSWFVDYRPFGNKRPHDWESTTLEKIIDFQNGYAFKSKELFSEPSDDTYQVFKQGHIARGGGFIPDGTKSWYPKSLSSKLNKYVLKKGDILMAMTDMKDNVAILGNTAIMPVDNEYILNQRVGHLRPNGYKGISYPYIFLLTNSHEFLTDLRSRANSGVQVNLSSSEIKSSEVFVAPEAINKLFSNISLPTFDMIINNQLENIRLSLLRDTLLPKLMSGEIDVSSINI